MPTVRVREWTKERIEAIRDAESHSSHDSVIKSLLKDRRLAQHVDLDEETTEQQAEPPTVDTGEPAIPGLTVLAELDRPDNGVLFLWCPNCENEIAHVTVNSPLSVEVFEIECQQCLTQLDQHALVAIDLSYPIEERLVDGTLVDDLQTCVTDYWDRALREASTAAVVASETDSAEDTSVDRLVWRIDRYVREFGWEWPTDVPIVAFEVDGTYIDTRTDERFTVVERLSNNRTDVDSYRVRRFPANEDESAPEAGRTDDEQGRVETIESETVAELILERAVQRVE
ncbi:hypothetical protein [Halococcus saccharolyticus]|uniref:Uncharacterized protein n=1 Tax=Halococcus saccharolyticus DSM 5350 TaxID=1227455 RepID=M0MBR1_9EURY|nr:hypothetical protein [Halococcus saccharolyticus]EMA43186.1 hypothetical protein C449_14447 [Halococcus saccharolyticus DSM 5350]